MIWMCQQIIEYKNRYNNDFSNFFDLKKIDYDAENLLNTFSISQNKEATPIIEIAKEMGFKIFYTNFEGENRNLSGMIGISQKLKNKFGGDKVIVLNGKDSDEHMLFTIAHEIAHYIYDYNINEKNKDYFNKYRTDEARTDVEERTNRFAASFMMPKTKFIRLFDENKNNKMSYKENIEYLKRYFEVPSTALNRRLIELEIKAYE